MNKTFRDFNLKNNPAGVDKIVGYDEITGEEIRIPVSVLKGVKGDAGAGISMLYSSDSESWHFPFQQTDIYMRLRLGNGEWTSAMRISFSDQGARYMIAENVDDITNKFLGLQAYNSVERYAIELISSSIPQELNQYAMCVSGNYIYFFGGNYSGNFTNKIFRYNIETSTMEELAEILPISVSEQGAIELNENIYLFGGQTSTGVNKNIFKYEIATGTISTLSENGVSMIKPELATDGTDIYIFDTVPNYSEAVYKYNISANSVSQMATLPVNINEAALCYNNGYLYLIGGSEYGASAIASIYKIDIEGNVTLLSNSLPKPLRGHKCVVVGTDILIMSGDSPSTGGISNDIYRLDTILGTISKIEEQLPNLNIRIYACSRNDNYIFMTFDGISDIYKYNPEIITRLEGLYVYKSDGWKFVI